MADDWSAGLDPTDRAVMRDDGFRVEMTSACRDTDVLEKVPDAGRVLEEDGHRVQVMFNGVRVPAGGYFGDWMSEIIERLDGHHEPQEELVFHEIMKHVPASGAMIELGAFWAYYSAWFMRGHAGTRRAIAVEPDAVHLEVGRETARLNDVEIEFVHACVGDHHEDLVEFDTADGHGTFSIPMVTVPDVMAQHGLDRLEILHCDTQGQELGVIHSCEELLRDGRIRFVVVSTHSHHISGDPLTHQECLATLARYGGRILAEHDVHESFSGDGLIVASFGDPVDWPADLHLSRNRQSTGLFRGLAVDLAEAFEENRRLAAELGQLQAKEEQWSRQRARLVRQRKRLRTERDQLLAKSRGRAPVRYLRRLARRVLPRRTGG
jgi:FkbM family methyltransferase